MSSTRAESLVSIPLMTRPADCEPREIIIGLNENGAVALTCGSPSAVFITSRYSPQSSPYLSTRMCAFTPRTFCWNESWNPDVTDSTTVSAETPMMTPMIETVVNTEKKLSSSETMKKIAVGIVRIAPSSACPNAKNATSTAMSAASAASVTTTTERLVRRR